MKAVASTHLLLKIFFFILLWRHQPVTNVDRFPLDSERLTEDDFLWVKISSANDNEYSWRVSEWPMFVDIESQHAGDMFENVVDSTCGVSMKIICGIFGSFAAKPWTRRLTVDNSWKYSFITLDCMKNIKKNFAGLWTAKICLQSLSYVVY